MKCVCCLNESEDKKVFCSITAADKRIYKEFTKLELNIELNFKICKECKQLLKTSSKFLQKCLKSHEKLTVENEVIKEGKEEKRRTRKRNIEEVEDPSEPPVNKPDEDDLPIARLQQQDHNEDIIVTVNQSEASEVDHADDGIFEDSQETQESVEEAKEEPKKPSCKFLCPECGISFQTAQRLQIHSFTHSGIKNYKCDFDGCEKSFATSFRLKAHTRTHTGERPFKCTECPLSFAQGNALKCHKRIHTKERPFVCTICSKSFAQNTTLKTHMAALHIGKSISCDEPGCDKKFTRKSYLILHKRDHQGLRKYACDRCPNHYKQKSHLDRHIESSHLGIRHKCDFPGCNSEFSKSWSLKMHKFSHKPENLLPYNCSICSAGFHRRDKWLKHINKNHPEESKDLQKSTFEIQELETKTQNEPSNFVVLTSSSEIYTIQNADGTLTHVRIME